MVSNTNSKHKLKTLSTLLLTENSKDLEGQSEVYVAGGICDRALRVTSLCIEYVPQLRSNHEEADSRFMLLIAYGGRQNTQQAFLSSPDTDALVSLVHFYQKRTSVKTYSKLEEKQLTEI